MGYSCKASWLPRAAELPLFSSPPTTIRNRAGEPCKRGRCPFWENLLATSSYCNGFIQPCVTRKAGRRQRNHGLIELNASMVLPEGCSACDFRELFWEVIMENVNTASPSDQDCAEDKFEGIIGNSAPLKFVLAEVQRVAPTDSTVLVLGETGSGKERIAGAIHKASTRRDRPFIKLNCAAIPFDLLESELFGYEKGAFTGAFAQEIGRFEMADTGTLFLDEIGDIPLTLQPKLLRVLQEKEFERLGSGKTHQIDVRLIAATHRDLTEMVSR